MSDVQFDEENLETYYGTSNSIEEDNAEPKMNRYVERLGVPSEYASMALILLALIFLSLSVLIYFKLFNSSASMGTVHPTPQEMLEIIRNRPTSR